MKTRLLCIICTMLLLACGKNGTVGSASSTPPSASLTAAPAISAKSDVLQINGLRLGMNIHEVPDAMMTMLADRQLSDFGFTDVIGIGSGAQCVLMYTKTYMQAIEARMRDRYGEARAPGMVDEELRNACADSSGVMTVQAGADGRVGRIAFNDVKNLFDAKDMPPAEIARKLVGEFKLPELQANEAQTAWTSLCPDGTRVELEAQNVMGIPMVRLFMSRAAP